MALRARGPSAATVARPDGYALATGKAAYDGSGRLRGAARGAACHCSARCAAIVEEMRKTVGRGWEGREGRGKPALRAAMRKAVQRQLPRAYGRQRLAKGEDEGVDLEIMAGLALLAFTVEARFNFLGHKLIKDWKEWRPFMKKVNAVFEHLGVVPDFKARPYLSIKQLKDFRDILAHGKPEDREFDQEVVVNPEELLALLIPRAEWETFIDGPRFFYEAYGDVEQIWATLLEKAGLSVLDTLSGGGSLTSFIEDYE